MSNFLPVMAFVVGACFTLPVPVHAGDAAASAASVASKNAANTKQADVGMSPPLLVNVAATPVELQSMHVILQQAQRQQVRDMATAVAAHAMMDSTNLSF